MVAANHGNDNCGNDFVGKNFMVCLSSMKHYPLKNTCYNFIVPLSSRELLTSADTDTNQLSIFWWIFTSRIYSYPQIPLSYAFSFSHRVIIIPSVFFLILYPSHCSLCNYNSSGSHCSFVSY